MMKNFKGKYEQAIRLLYLNSIALINNSVVVVEYPKSGGTWLGQLISEYLDIPFPRNTIPSPVRNLYHGHYLPRFFSFGKRKIILLVRDGRDVMVSQYHHQLIWNDKNRKSPKNVHYYRKMLNFEDYNDVKANLANYIEFSFTHTPSKRQQFTFMGNWAEFNEAWLNKKRNSNNIYLISYEDLLKDPVKAMEKLLNEFLGEKTINIEHLKNVIEKYSFEKQANRKKGEEDSKSFLRKGISGDWKNYFGSKEKDIFKKHANKVLVQLGYEFDDKW